jgi:hypothetical protein
MRTRRLGRTIALLAATIAVAALAAPAADATLAFLRWHFPDSPLWVAHDDGSAAHLLIPSAFRPRISPNGRTIVYRGADGLRAISAAGGRSRLLARDAELLAWSPDSRTIAANVPVPRSERARLMTIDIASGKARTLATGPGFSASFSPHGGALVYRGGSGHDEGLYTIPAHGGRPTLVVRDSRAFDPLWGRLWIVYVRSRLPSLPYDTRKWDLWLVKPSGTQNHQLTHQHPGRGLAGLRPVAWSANGHRLVAEFLGDGADYAETVNPFTGAIRRVGKPHGGERGIGLFPTGISRDGTTILGSTGGLNLDGNAYALPYHGGKPRLLARHAIEPSWSR